MNKLKVCAYARVSTNSTDQANSYENQKSFFERELSKNDKYEFVGIYADKGISGTKLHREEFNKMLNDAGLDIKEVKSDNKRKIKYVVIESEREPLFNYIFVKNTSRFARNIEVISILRELRNKGVYVHFLDISKSTENMDDITYIEIFLSFDERDSIDKSKKVKFGMLEGANQGKLYTNGKLYGYKYIKEENRLDIVEDEAEVVRLVFQMYSEGNGLRIIESYLQENGIVNLKTGKVFNKASLNNMLKNPKYAGINASLVWDSGEVFNTKYARMKSKEEWITNKDTNKIPPIVSEELFEKCENMRNSKINTKTQKGVRKASSKYAGIIKCGICRANYNVNTNRGTVFYNCSNKKAHGIKFCNSPNVSLELLEQEIDELCKGEYNHIYEMFKEYNTEILKRYSGLISKKIDKDLVEQVKENKNELDKLKKGHERLLDLYQSLEIDKDTYLERSSIIKERIELLENQIEKDSRGNAQMLYDIASIESTIREFSNFKLKKVYTREEIMNELSYIEIFKNEFFDLHPKAPIDIIRRLYETCDYSKPCICFIFKWMEVYSDIVVKYRDLI